jgi:hypothetical protein
VREDEVATMPGLGGVGFTDRRTPSTGWNSPTPYIQLYCQEKVPTYAPFGTKERGSAGLDQIPARKIPMSHMLDCSGEEESKLEQWVAAEKRIMSEATKSRTRSFPARLEIRTSLPNILETTYNTIVALSETARSDALRHFEKDHWFRWKGLRAEYLARLPGTVFGRREERASDWIMVHTLVAAQTFIHGLHSRVSTITLERDSINMHSLYLLVVGDRHGPTYQFPEVPLSLRERASSKAYRPFFPAGVRTFDGYFDVKTGVLDYASFEDDMRGMCSAEALWSIKVRRGVNCHRNSGLNRLRGLITYPRRQDRPRLQRPQTVLAAIRPMIPPAGSPIVYIQQDVGYQRLETLINQKVDAILNSTLHLNSREGRDLSAYLEENEILDIPHIVIRYGRSLGMLRYLDEAHRLVLLRQQHEDVSRDLVISATGEVEVAPERHTTRVRGVPLLGEVIGRRLEPGGLDVYNFQKNLPTTIRKTHPAVRCLSIRWELDNTKNDALGMSHLTIDPALRQVKLPRPKTLDEEEDDEAYRDWLRRAEDTASPFLPAVHEAPSLADFLVFILSSFQHQLLKTLPRTVRRNKRNPEMEGVPYIQAETESMNVVLRASYKTPTQVFPVG